MISFSRMGGITVERRSGVRARHRRTAIRLEMSALRTSGVNSEGAAATYPSTFVAHESDVDAPNAAARMRASAPHPLLAVAKRSPSPPLPAAVWSRPDLGSAPVNTPRARRNRETVMNGVAIGELKNR
jgi:hypothetical protein